MDEEYSEFGGEVISNLDKIRAIDNNDELMKFWNSLDSGQQGALQEEFNKRSREINEADAENAKKNATKPKKAEKKAE